MKINKQALLTEYGRYYYYGYYYYPVVTLEGL